MPKKRVRDIAGLLLLVFMATIAEKGLHQLAHAHDVHEHGHGETYCGIPDTSPAKGLSVLVDAHDEICALCDHFASQSHFDLSAYNSVIFLSADASKLGLGPCGELKNEIGLHTLRGPPSV